MVAAGRAVTGVAAISAESRADVIDFVVRFSPIVAMVSG
jgi:hypothetical protein